MKNIKAIILLGVGCMVASAQAGVFNATTWVNDSSLPFSTNNTYTHAIDFAEADGSFDINGVTITQKAVTNSNLTGMDSVSGKSYTFASSSGSFITAIGTLQGGGVSGTASTELAKGLMASGGQDFPFTITIEGLETNTDYTFKLFNANWSGDAGQEGRKLVLDGDDDGVGNTATYQQDSAYDGAEIIEYAYNTGESTTFTMTGTFEFGASAPHFYSFANVAGIVVPAPPGVFSVTDWVDDSSLPFSTDKAYTHAIDFAGVDGSFDVNGVTVTQKGVTNAPMTGTDSISGLGYTISAQTNWWTDQGNNAQAVGTSGLTGAASTNLATGMISYWAEGFPMIIELQGLQKNTDYTFTFFSPLWDAGDVDGRIGILDGVNDGIGNTFTIQQDPDFIASAQIVEYAYNTGDYTTFAISLSAGGATAGAPHFYSFANSYKVGNYQSWAVSKGLTAGVNDGEGDDPDVDGRNNLREYALDGDPLVSDADNGKMLEAFVDAGGTNVFSLTFPARTGASFSGTDSKYAAIDGVAYTVAGFSDLITTGPVEITELQPASTNGMPVLNGGWEYKTFWTPSEDSQRFIKLTTDLP